MNRLLLAMDDKTWVPRAVEPRAWIDNEMAALGRPSILLVEDDDDTRELLVTLLDLAGFESDPCGSAEEGLERLREGTYDLVLTDYCLPQRSGGWLLKQASAEGLLDAVPALVVTAHPSPDDTTGFEVICKPFDLDELVERVRRRLTEDGERSGKSNGPRPSRPNAPDGGDANCPDPIELILYVTDQSQCSPTALENIKAVLSRFNSSRISLTICDLSQDPSAGNEDKVAFTPTLVKRAPGPRTFILGHLTNPALLLEILESCEES